MFFHIFSLQASKLIFSLVQLHPSSHAAKAFEPYESLMTQACAWRSCTSCMHPGLVAGDAAARRFSSRAYVARTAAHDSAP